MGFTDYSMQRWDLPYSVSFSAMSNDPSSYYAIGIVDGEFDHHLWTNEKEAREFYKKPNCTLIKGWAIEIINGEGLVKKWEKAQKLCE